MKNMITDVKTVKQGVYRMLDIVEAHVSTRCQFKEIFHNLSKKKNKNYENKEGRGNCTV